MSTPPQSPDQTLTTYKPSAVLMEVPELDRHRWATLIDDGVMWLIGREGLSIILTEMDAQMHAGCEFKDSDIAQLLRGREVEL